MDSDRVSEALRLLESSGYDERMRSQIADSIFSDGDIDAIIEDLKMNQVDTWQNYRLKDINRRLDLKGC